MAFLPSHNFNQCTAARDSTFCARFRVFLISLLFKRLVIKIAPAAHPPHTRTHITRMGSTRRSVVINANIACLPMGARVCACDVQMKSSLCLSHISPFHLWRIGEPMPTRGKPKIQFNLRLDVIVWCGPNKIKNLCRELPVTHYFGCFAGTIYRHMFVQEFRRPSGATIAIWLTLYMTSSYCAKLFRNIPHTDIINPFGHDYGSLSVSASLSFGTMRPNTVM